MAINEELTLTIGPNIRLEGWGRYPQVNCLVQRPERLQELANLECPLIPRGLGRSYGDASLNADRTVISMNRLDRYLSFDPATGILRAEAGASVQQILRDFVPKGWFLPVVPGTQFVTLGGCIAADIHGKNHHRDGCFSPHVTSLTLVTCDGRQVRCSPNEERELFWATIGGMGLTGIILEAEILLQPVNTAYIVAHHQQAHDLDHVLDLLAPKKVEEKYSVAWIDCLAGGKQLGRSIVIVGRHAETQELPKNITTPLTLPARRIITVPFACPSWLLNRYSMKAFNELYYRRQSTKTAPFVTDYQQFFFPLDSVNRWNLIYGPKGFVQYQFVLPMSTSSEGMRDILTTVSNSKHPSFLAVLKRFGPENPAYLSFPIEGYTLALDIPIRDDTLFPFLERLDQKVLKYGGRVYLAKDARMSQKVFQKAYPKFSDWLAIKERWDPHHCFSSNLSRRLGLGGKNE